MKTTSRHGDAGPSRAGDGFDRYLGLLNVSGGAPSLKALRDIVRAHLVTIPFENISKLFYWKTMGFNASMDRTTYLDGIEKYHFGGTCYANNFHMHELLKHLGYDVTLCGADMSKPDVHLVNIVKVEGREFIVDAGYAAPFFEPLPVDLPEDHVVTFGVDRYVVSPKDENGRSRVTFWKDGSPTHGYSLNPAPRTIDEFAGVIADSFRPEATFMNALLLVKFGDESSRVIRNMTFTESSRNVIKKKEFETMEQVVKAIEEFFEIPSSVLQRALGGFVMNMDAFS